jgi:hypothetical protein
MATYPLTNQEYADHFQWYRRSGASQISCPRLWGHNISQNIYIKNLQCLWEAVCWKLPHTWLLVPASDFGQCSVPSGPECQGLLGKAQHFSGFTLPFPHHLALCDLLLLPKLKITLKGKRFQGIPRIHLNTTCRCWPTTDALNRRITGITPCNLEHPTLKEKTSIVTWKCLSFLTINYVLDIFINPHKPITSLMQIWISHTGTHTQMYMSTHTHSLNNTNNKTGNAHITLRYAQVTVVTMAEQ